MDHKAESLIRSFGMSGYQLTGEIRDIEKKFNVELGHLPAASGSKEPDYYPQFEQEVRAEAAEMAAHYEAFYCLEKSIRKLINETMEEVLGSLWWDSGK